MLETQGGEVLRRKEITLRGLLWYQFEYNAIANNEKQLRHLQVLLLKNKWYVVQFWELASMTKDLTTVRHEFFGSVGVKPGFTLEDQMNRRPPGFLFGKILGYLLITALFGVLIKWILRKKKKPQTDTLDSIV